MPGSDFDTRFAEEEERNLLARDSYRSSASLAILIISWVAVLVAVGLPYPTSYELARLALAAFAFVGLVYLARTWQRPRLRGAVVFSLTATVGVVLLIPWSAHLAAELGERWQPVATTQLALASVPLVALPFAWVGYALVVTFSAELVLIELYQQHVGLGPLVGAEPFGSLTVAVISLAVLLLRKERQRIGLAYIRAMSEAAALSRLASMFSALRSGLEQTVDTLKAVATFSASAPPAFSRSMTRLTTLGAQLQALSAPAVPQNGDRVSKLLARDSHSAAFIFTVAALAVMVMAIWSTRGLPEFPSRSLLWALALGYAGLAVYLWSTRQRPTVQRGVTVSVLILAGALVLAVLMHRDWLRLDAPVFPFIGEKLMVMVLVLLRFPRLWIGLTLLSLIVGAQITIDAIFATQPDALAPWHMLLFAQIGAGFLVMGEHRRIASLALLRAEAMKSSLFRRAHLSIAVSDELNTPLQTFIWILETLPPSAMTTEAASRIEQLHAVSRQLSQLIAELPPELQATSLNSAQALQRRA